MQVTVRLFATYREVAGSKELKVQLAAGATVRSLLDAIYAKHPRLKGFVETLLLAVNNEFVDAASTLREGDEAALLPPECGGEAPQIGTKRKAIDLWPVM